jgi:hypothetical protein
MTGLRGAAGVDELTYMNAKSADGPSLVKWVEKVLAGDMASVPESQMRRLNEWRKDGARADFYAVDTLLIRLGLHPCFAPQEVWRAESVYKTARPRGLKPVGPNPNPGFCMHCGDPLTRYEGESSSNFLKRKFCCVEHRQLGMRRSKLSEKECERCGGTYKRKYYKNGTLEKWQTWVSRRTCSVKCNNELRAAEALEKGQETKECHKCGGVFTRLKPSGTVYTENEWAKRLFCGHSCASSHSARERWAKGKAA